MMIDMKELLKTVLRFAIWAMLFIVTMFAGMIVLSIIHPSVWQGSEQAATEYFKDSVISGWINLAATLLFIILFLVLRWASLSKGILERSLMWKLVGLLLVLTVADICFEVSLIDLPAYHNLFPETWAEMEADNSPDSGGITKYLYACLLIPIFEEIGFRVIPSTICHIANNTIALCTGPVMMYITGSRETDTTPTTDVIVIVIAIALMLSALILINRMVPKR